MPELVSTLDAARERIYSERKFLAAIQGVDLEDSDEDEKPQRTWEDIKASAFSGNKNVDSNDILSLSGITAQQKGFGVGQGIAYSKSDEDEWWIRK